LKNQLNKIKENLQNQGMQDIINQNDLDEIDDDLNKSEEDEINENNEIPDDIL
jgi:hypothetical protein